MFLRLPASTGVFAMVPTGREPLEPPVASYAFLYGALARALPPAVDMDCEMGVRMLILAVGVYFDRYCLMD